MKRALLVSIVAVSAIVVVGSLSEYVGTPVPDRPSGPVDVDCPDCNVILISADTLRPDHLGCYGYGVDTSPAIDELCGDAVRFDRAFTAAPSTLPSHASLFTGLLPFQHRASRSAGLPLPDDAVTLAEVLRDHGYDTAAFVDGGQMDPVWGVGQGFEVYSSVPRRRLRRTVDNGIRWIDSRRRSGRSFLLLLHSYEVHHPYTPPARFIRTLGSDYQGPLPWRIHVGLLRQVNKGNFLLDRRDLQHVVSLYDAEIRSLDEALGRLIDYLRRTGQYDDTLLILVSDHGEEFGEHGQVGWHAHTLYNELLRVALVLKLPASSYAGSVVGDTVSLLDVYPTVLEVLGLPAARQPDGGTLLDALRGGRPPWTTAVSEQEYGIAGVAIQSRRWKFLDSRLYDLVADPGETTDVARRYPGMRAILEAKLREYLARPALAFAEPVEPAPETIEQLRALGYIR